MEYDDSCYSVNLYIGWTVEKVLIRAGSPAAQAKLQSVVSITRLPAFHNLFYLTRANNLNCRPGGYRSPGNDIAELSTAETSSLSRLNL